MTGTRTSLATLLGTAALLATVGMAAGGQMFFVSTDGDDGWSGATPAPNAARTDGPFASLARARDAVRQWRTQQDKLPDSVQVQIRGGTYYLSEPLTLTSADTGTSECPVTYEADRSVPQGLPVSGSGRRGLRPGGRQHSQSRRLDGVPGSGSR